MKKSFLVIRLDGSQYVHDLGSPYTKYYQDTGLRDINGKPIYFGNRVRDKDGNTGTVYWDTEDCDLKFGEYLYLTKGICVDDRIEVFEHEAIPVRIPVTESQLMTLISEFRAAYGEFAIATAIQKSGVGVFCGWVTPVNLSDTERQELYDYLLSYKFPGINYAKELATLVLELCKHYGPATTMHFIRSAGCRYQVKEDEDQLHIVASGTDIQKLYDHLKSYKFLGQQIPDRPIMRSRSFLKAAVESKQKQQIEELFSQLGFSSRVEVNDAICVMGIIDDRSKMLRVLKVYKHFLKSCCGEFSANKLTVWLSKICNNGWLGDEINNTKRRRGIRVLRLHLGSIGEVLADGASMSFYDLCDFILDVIEPPQDG